jgi:hypothetical protein
MILYSAKWWTHVPTIKTLETSDNKMNDNVLWMIIEVGQ